MNSFKCVSIPDAEQQKYQWALADVLCWMNGFVQGGGEYSPETIYVLRDVQRMIERAYPTIPPSDKQPFVVVYTPLPITPDTVAIERAFKMAKTSNAAVEVHFNQWVFIIFPHYSKAEAIKAFDMKASKK